MSEKLIPYQEALENIKKELSQKRTELSTLSRKTVEELENSIPGLREQVSQLTAEISRFDSILIGKKREANTEHESCVAKYESLENVLKESYRIAKENIESIEQAQNTREHEHKLKLSELEAREFTLSQNRANLIREQEDLNNLKNEFAVQKNNGSSDISKAKDGLEKRAAVLKNKEELLEAKISTVANELKILTDKKLEAEVVLSRIFEAENILNAAKDKEKFNSEREAKINESNIKLIADTKRLNARAAALETKEAALGEREENLKIAEAAQSEK